MQGTIVNTLAILGGCILGVALRNGLSERFKNIIMQAIGLSVLFIGLTSAIGGLLKPDAEPILFIVSMVIGGIIGEALDIEKRLDSFGRFIQSKIGNGEHNISQGFVTASLIFCVGTMAIIGSLESGLRKNHNMLYAKSVLDGITSIILTSSLGLGVFLSAVAVFVYQGAIVMFASVIEPYLTVDVVREMSIIGGILICGIGITILDLLKVKTANFLPAIFVPVAYYLLLIPIFNRVSAFFY